ncbi:MAG TPA: hypothetical protein VGC49_04615 [Solirubrobacterales bacterium]
MAIAIRIGIRGEEEPLSEPLFGLLTGCAFSTVPPPVPLLPLDCDWPLLPSAGLLWPVPPPPPVPALPPPPDGLLDEEPELDSFEFSDRVGAVAPPVSEASAFGFFA